MDRISIFAGINIPLPRRENRGQHDFLRDKLTKIILEKIRGSPNYIVDFGDATLKQPAKVLSGLALKGGTVGRADKDVAKWLKKLGLIP